MVSRLERGATVVAVPLQHAVAATTIIPDNCHVAFNKLNEQECTPLVRHNNYIYL